MMKHIQENIFTWVHGKQAVAVHVCAVLKKLDQHTSPLTANEHLKDYCRNVLLNKVVCIDSVVDLTGCKLSRAYGICYIIVKKCVPSVDGNSKYNIITQQSCIHIEAVQSADFYNLTRNVKPISLGGFNHEIEQLSCLLNYNKSNISSLLRPRGVLLHGPPGCGKSSLAKYLAYKCKAVLISLEGSNILQAEFGSGAESLKTQFKRAVTLSEEGPVILFVDEIDTLCPDGEHTSLGSKQLTCALASEMDSLRENNVSGLLVVAATNFISSVNAVLRRPGRFDKEVLVNVPTQQQRIEILQVLMTDLNVAPDVSLPELASCTVAFVGADLQALCEEAVNHAHSHIESSVTDLIEPKVHMSHFVQALHTVSPSMKRGLDCVVEVKPVKWKDIGGLEEVKAEIRQSVEWPLLYPEALRRLGLSATKGILLYGPPGCCKTTLVRAAATSCNVTFLTLNGAQVYSQYLGESQKIISEAFQKARALSPSILFFDEIESIVGSRTNGSSNNRVQENILATMLNEMDGVGTRLDTKLDASLARQTGNGQMMQPGSSSTGNYSHSADSVSDTEKSHVIVIGATNRPDMIDSAILRPGRFDKMIYVPPPDLKSRESILKIQLSTMAAQDINVEELSKKTEFFSGADLKNLCMEAGLTALREHLKTNGDISSLFVTNTHFAQALDVVKPSLTASLLKLQKKLLCSFKE